MMDTTSAEPPEAVAGGFFIVHLGREGLSMLSKKIYSILLVAIFFSNIIGCGVSNIPNFISTKKAQLVSISITPTNSIIATGTSQQFTAVGTYADNTTRDLTTTATWISTDASVATI